MSVLRRVLIIDDNVGLAENIAEILGIAGHATQVAASAEEGLSKALENEPDVVVTDFRLPGINGAVFVKEFLVTRMHVRAMAISAYTDDTTIEEATAAGAAFMGKPLDYFAPERMGWRPLRAAIGWTNPVSSRGTGACRRAASTPATEGNDSPKQDALAPDEARP